jgi:hypothetical protein
MLKATWSLKGSKPTDHLQAAMPRDTCANYNAFGRDPDGWIAHLAAWFFGPEWIPPFPAQIFAGPPEPPRYGPSAEYQLRSLPWGFTPTPPPQYYGPPTAPYIDPPPYFHPSLFNALRRLDTYDSGGMCRGLIIRICS